MQFAFEKFQIPYERNFPLAQHTTFHIGGAAEWGAFPRTIQQAVLAIRETRKRNLPYHVIGKGSNLLVSDTGLKGVVVFTNQLAGITCENEQIEVEAGVPLGKLIAFCQKRGLSGLEALVGIPATIGGAVAMNAGANDVEIADCIDSVTFYDVVKDEILKYSKTDFHFAYRHTLCHEREGVILSATFSLARKSPSLIRQTIFEVASLRKAKQPLDYPSAGSIFKRPFPYYAPVLIERAGLKGKCIGDAMVSTKHAGFIINLGGAKSTDVECLMKIIQETVYEKFVVCLSPEIVILRDDVAGNR